MCIFLVPLGVLEWYFLPRSQAVDWFGTKPDLPFPIIFHVLFAGLSWGGNVVLWVVALQYTTTVHASIIQGTQPMIVSVYYQCIGQPISSLEWLGIFFCIVGMFISSLTKSFTRHEAEEETDLRSEIYGDALVFLSAVFEVFILINRNKVKPYCPLMQYTAFTTAIVVIVSTLSAIWLEQSHVMGLCDQCIFGWASHTWAHFMLPFGFFIGVVCISGFNYAVSFLLYSFYILTY